jgi:hypothetical protein
VLVDPVGQATATVVMHKKHINANHIDICSNFLVFIFYIYFVFVFFGGIPKIALPATGMFAICLHWQTWTMKVECLIFISRARQAAVLAQVELSRRRWAGRCSI